MPCLGARQRQVRTPSFFSLLRSLLTSISSQATCPRSAAHDFFWTDAAGSAVTCSSSTSSCLECLSSVGRYSLTSTTLGRNVTFSGIDVASCYCKRTLTRLVYENGPFRGTQLMLAGGDATLCAGVAGQFVNYHAITILASLVVVAVNISLRYLLKWMAASEGHHSISALHEAIAFKVRRRCAKNASPCNTCSIIPSV